MHSPWPTEDLKRCYSFATATNLLFILTGVNPHKGKVPGSDPNHETAKFCLFFFLQTSSPSSSQLSVGTTHMSHLGTYQLTSRQRSVGNQTPGGVESHVCCVFFPIRPAVARSLPLSRTGAIRSSTAEWLLFHNRECYFQVEVAVQFA